jgi:hypothetical protein
MIILPILALYILAQARGCVSRVSNRTIDDFNGDEVTGVVPVYIPANRWNVVVVRAFIRSWMQLSMLSNDLEKQLHRLSRPTSARPSDR